MTRMRTGRQLGQLCAAAAAVAVLIATPCAFAASAPPATGHADGWTAGRKPHPAGDPAAVPTLQVVTPSVWRALADSRMTLRVSVRHYDVYGRTVPQLVHSMDRSGPAAIGSKRAIGAFELTRESLGYWVSFGSHCSVSRPDEQVDVLIWLPRWVDTATGSAGARAWWQRVSRDIQQHEQEHAFIALTQLRAIPALLDAMPSYPTCDRANAQVHALADARALAATHLNAQFDHWTHNGTAGPYWLG